MVSIKSTILVIDDEPQIQKLLKVIMEVEGYRVETASGGKEGIRLCTSIKPDIVVLDLFLEDMLGIDVITHVRSWSQVPILVLSVSSENENVVQALDHGADDYVVKPFVSSVLLARVRALMRKGVQNQGGLPEITNGSISMNLIKHQVYIDNKQVKLSPKEYELLRYFMINKGKMVTHSQILKEIWGVAHKENTQYLRVYVGQLRQKIEEDLQNPKYIITEPGIGYRMEDFQYHSSSVSPTAVQSQAVAMEKTIV
jgi:two-component system KDP operon response regulator KdpE